MIVLFLVFTSFFYLFTLVHARYRRLLSLPTKAQTLEEKLMYIDKIMYYCVPQKLLDFGDIIWH